MTAEAAMPLPVLEPPDVLHPVQAGLPSLKHLPALDGVRGLAILMVMEHHFSLIQNADRLWQFTEFGRFGVDLFFVLSGYLITGILLDSRGKPGALRNFYMRRVLRIFPLYYVIVFVSFALLALLPRLHLATFSLRLQELSASGPHEVIWYLTYTSNFLVARLNAWHNPFLDVSWSLAIEEQFYLAWAPVVLFLSPRMLKHFFILVIIGAFVTRLWLALHGYSELQLYVLTPCRIDALAIGALVAWLSRSGSFATQKLLAISRWLAIPLTAAVLTLWVFGLLREQRLTSMTIGVPLVSGLFATLLIFSGNGVGTEFFESRLLQFFGRYSYCIYLVHLPIRALLRDAVFGRTRFDHLSGAAVAWQLLFYVVATLAVIPVAVLSWNLLEKRFLALKRFFEYAPPPARLAQGMAQ